MKKVLIVAIVILLLGFVITQTDLFRSDKPSTFQETSISSPTPSSEKLNEQTACTGVLTPPQAEGPYYKAGSPERNNITQGISGEKLVVSGYVYDKNCKPIPNAWLDFWQADSNGAYDNVGYKLRGHQYTDENGMYRLETIVPAAYESRPPHIHVKARAGSEPALTSQLYFPEQKQNQSDSIFNKALLMIFKDTKNGKLAQFNFVLNY